MNLENPSQKHERKLVKENNKSLFDLEKKPKPMDPPGIFQNSNTSRLRESAISRIRQLAETSEFQYTHLVQFHAITYFDRCLSRVPDLDQEYLDKFIITCTVLAAKKMSESNDFSMEQFLETNGLKNKLEAIKSMECQIRHLLKLSTELESITALSFIDFFLSLIYDNDTAKANDGIYGHILSMHHDPEFVQFKPSIIAAVAIVAEITENGPGGDPYDPILRCKFVDTDEFEKCFDLLKSRLKENEGNGSFSGS